MLYKLVLPGPIDDLSEVRVLEWHGSPDTEFNPGDLMVELDTHKAVVEMRASSKTVLRRILIAAGEWQQVGAPLAILSDSADESLPERAEQLAQSSVTYEMV
ncbi:MAG TPA: lipoyl domain-containing protein [Steroidobacteraceae bacterium]|jgi:pyruvate/2-oxoglutarate dehydrogenase complex dihydrolipoamide acyltransferase (E2) component|nr:lipoyl domain-containing protein [Steroidobacteraceae bacterium]